MAIPNPTTATTANKDPEEIDWLPLIRECVRVLRANWKWFVLSVIICTGLAFLYAQSRPRVYKRTATMQVEDANSSTSSRRMPSNMNALMELNVIAVGD